MGILAFMELAILFDIEHVFLYSLPLAIPIALLMWYFIMYELDLKNFFILFLVSSLLLTSLPNVLPGIFVYMGKDDASTYIGMVIDIIKGGKVPNYNFYPSMPILASILTYITDSNVYSTIKMLTTVYYFIFLFLIVILSRTIIRSKFPLSIIGFTFIHMAWYMPSSFYPHFVVIMLLLIMMYLLLNDMTSTGKTGSASTVIEMIVITTMIFTHPFSIHYIVILIISILFAIFISKKILSQKANMRRIVTKIMYLLSIAFTLYFLWFFNIYLEGRPTSMRYIIEELMNNMLFLREGKMPIQEDISRSLLGAELLYRGLNTLLDDILLYLLFIATFISLLKRKNNIINLSFLVLIVGIIYYSIMTFMLMLTKLHVIYRIAILNPALPLVYTYSIILLHNYRRDSKSSKPRNNPLLHILALILLLSYIIGSISLVPSARISIPFNATYSSEFFFGKFIGMYINTQSPSIAYFSRVFIPLYRILDSIYGYDSARHIVGKEIALPINHVLGINNSIFENEGVLQPSLEYATFLVIGEYDTHIYKSLNRLEIANLVALFQHYALQQCDLLYNSGSIFLLRI